MLAFRACRLASGPRDPFQCFVLLIGKPLHIPAFHAKHGFAMTPGQAFPKALVLKH
jgi:hypothetical protein